MENKESLEQNKKILTSTIIIISIIIFIVFLLNSNYIGLFSFNYINNPNTGEQLSIPMIILYYIFIDFCVFTLYSAILHFISLIQWHILHRKDEKLLKKGYIPEYFNELDDISKKIIPIIVLSEILFANILIMFSIINFN